jgi:pimeloyl-ACP methyl ester carboxylesterase
MFDYGVQGNMERYQREVPPAYDMSHYPSQHVPTLVVSGQKDAFANARDVAHLLREMPASPNLHTLVVPNFGHLDFVFGYNANTLVYNHILSFFQA